MPNENDVYQCGFCQRRTTEEAPQVFLSFSYSKKHFPEATPGNPELGKTDIPRKKAVRPKSFAHKRLPSQYQGGTWYAVLNVPNKVVVKVVINNQPMEVSQL
jgi:hypothetical protein